MATVSIVQARVIGHSGGDPLVMRGGPGFEDEAYEDGDSTAWVAGAWLARDTDGEIEELGSGQVALILGQAMEAASGTDGTAVFYRPLRPGTRLVLNVHHDAPASAVTARNQLDLLYNLSYESNKLLVDIEDITVDTAKPVVRIVGFWPEDALGDVNGRVIAEVVDTAGLQG